MHKLQAYQLQDAGADTVDANLALGVPGGRTGLRYGRTDSVRPRCEDDAAADEQPREADRPGRANGLTVVDRVPLSVLAEPGEPALPADQA